MSSYKSYVPWSKRERENSYSSTKSDSSTQQQNDASGYKSRTNSALGANAFGRGTSTASQLPSYRTSYSTVSPANSNRATSKERTLPSYGSSYTKREKDKQEERPTYKYVAGPKDSDKHRLHTERAAVKEEARSKSPLSGSRSSLLEKYSNLRDPTVKSSDRPTSVLDKYTRGASRERSREPDAIPRFVSSTYPGTTGGKTYTSDHRPVEKKERAEHPPISYRGIRVPSGRSSREPSPEIAGSKSSCYSRVYSRAPSYGRTVSGGLLASESASTPATSSRYSAAGTRFGLTPRSSADHVPTAISYSGSDRFRASSSKRSMTPLKDDVASCVSMSRADGPLRNDASSRKTEVDPKTCEKSDAANSQSYNDQQDDEDEVEEEEENEEAEEEEEEEEETEAEEVETVTVVTRGTSPSSSTASSYVRSRRADTAKMIEKEITRPKRRPEMKDEEMQSDRMDDTARFSRYGGGRVTVTPWTSYLGKYSPSSSKSSGYTSRSYGTGGGSSSLPSRIGGFGFPRSADSRIASPGVGQETQKVPNDSSSKVQSSEQRPSSITKPSSSNGPSHFNSTTNVVRTVVPVPSREESPTKTDGFGSGSLSDQKSDSLYEDESCSGSKSSIPKIEATNQRTSSPPKIETLSGSKTECKLTKSSSSCDFSPLKGENANNRHRSTPKLDSVRSAYDESLHRREGTPGRKENSQSRRDSLSKSDSGSSHSGRQLSGNNSGKNVSRQISRTDSSDSAANASNGRSKSSSASSMTSLSAKIRTTPSPLSGKSSLGSTRQSTPVDGGARGKPPR
nr:histone H3.v1-like [Neodiprion pinetum]